MRNTLSALADRAFVRTLVILLTRFSDLHENCALEIRPTERTRHKREHVSILYPYFPCSLYLLDVEHTIGKDPRRSSECLNSTVNAVRNGLLIPRTVVLVVKEWLSEHDQMITSITNMRFHLLSITGQFVVPWET